MYNLWELENILLLSNHINYICWESVTAQLFIIAPKGLSESHAAQMSSAVNVWFPEGLSQAQKEGGWA